MLPCGIGADSGATRNRGSRAPKTGGLYEACKKAGRPRGRKAGLDT